MEHTLSKEGRKWKRDDERTFAHTHKRHTHTHIQNYPAYFGPGIQAFLTQSHRIPVLFFFLFLWVFEIQLLMQIIVNRIAIIAEDRKTVFKLKWGTAAVITCINIAVFCIWIPAHTVPPVSEL